MVVKVTLYFFISSSMLWHYSLSIPLVSQISILKIKGQLKNIVFACQAWIQADANRYNGANKEVPWSAFVNFGLGVGATYYNDSDLLHSHFKPVVIFRGQTKLPPLIGTNICGFNHRDYLNHSDDHNDGHDNHTFINTNTTNASKQRWKEQRQQGLETCCVSSCWYLFIYFVSFSFSFLLR